MTDEQWNEADAARARRSSSSGRAIEPSARGEIVTDDDFLWLINASADDIEFTVPDGTLGR